MILYVEGGGDSDTLRTKGRQAFSQLFQKAQIQNKPRIVLCGGRRATMDRLVINWPRQQTQTPNPSTS